jgi:ClpP class serine protease
MNELIASGAIQGWGIDVEDKVHMQKPAAKIILKLNSGGGLALTSGDIAVILKRKKTLRSPVKKAFPTIAKIS